MRSDAGVAETQRIVNPLDVFGAGIWGDVLYCKVPARIGFIRDGELPAGHSTDKSEDEFVGVVHFSVDADQPFDGDFQAGFLPGLTNGGFSGQFTALDAPAREIPHIAVAPVPQEDAATLVKDDGKSPDGEQMLASVFVR